MSYLLIEGNFALMGGENNPFHSSDLHYLFAQQPHHKRPKRDWFRPLLPACRPLDAPDTAENELRREQLSHLQAGLAICTYLVTG